MWDTLQVIYDGATAVKKARMNTLIYEYELFRLKHGEKYLGHGKNGLFVLLIT